MKVLLISTNRNTLPMPVIPIGACIAAEAAERSGHAVQLLDLMFTGDAMSAVRAAVVGCKPDVIGLSVRNIDNNDMRHEVFFLDEVARMAAAIRTWTAAPIVLGGAALGVMPEEILRLAAASCCVIGDGEMVFPRLLDHIARGADISDVPGVGWIEEGMFRRNPAASEWSPACASPDYQRWLNVGAYRRHLATAAIQTKTGCQFHCSYCTYPKIEGSAYRLKEPGSVADAVVRLAAAGLRDIEIVDSVFNAPRDHAMNVCAALAQVRHNARLQCLELNPRYVDDALLAAMERAGFAGIGITVESASDPVLRGLKKGFTTREVHAAAAAVQRHRIPCAWIFMLGGPGETRETVKETLQFAEQGIGPGDVAFFNTGIRIYPGTDLESTARNQGVLSRSRDNLLAPVFYVSPDVDALWMERELKASMSRHMNFLNMDSLGLSFLPAIHRICHQLGVRPPLWRHTRIIRRSLRIAGMDV